MSIWVRRGRFGQEGPTISNFKVLNKLSRGYSNGPWCPLGLTQVMEFNQGARLRPDRKLLQKG